MNCHCGKSLSFSSCCERILSGEPAKTAEELMRARYTAYVTGNADFILSTWAEESERPTREELAETFDTTRFVSLEVLTTEGGQIEDSEGQVAFIATFESKQKRGPRGELRENSKFEKRDGRWIYVDGKPLDARTLALRHSPALKNGKPQGAQKIGRNAPCPCGSGRKYKYCCGK